MRAYEELPLILLVEDSQDDYDTTIRSFRKVHLNNPIKWCKSGREALDFLKKEGQYTGDSSIARPSLILLDLNMPGIDGRRVLNLIKQDSSLKMIPVVILTTSSDEKDVESCYSLGASTYIQKPVDFLGLVEAVGRMKDYWFQVALLPTGEGTK